MPFDSLSRLGSTEHDKFCESFEIVVKDTTLPIPQQDILNILEPWRKVCMIDEDLLVCFAVHAPSFNFVQSQFYPPPPQYVHFLKEDETGQFRGILEKDVITAFNTYMNFLYCIGTIRCPTKVYFKLSTLAGESRCCNDYKGGSK